MRKMTQRAVAVAALSVTCGAGLVATSTAASADAAGCTTVYSAAVAAAQAKYGPKVSVGIPGGGYNIGDPVALEKAIQAATKAYVDCVG